VVCDITQICSEINRSAEVGVLEAPQKGKVANSGKGRVELVVEPAHFVAIPFGARPHRYI